MTDPTLSERIASEASKYLPRRRDWDDHMPVSDDVTAEEVREARKKIEQAEELMKESIDILADNPDERSSAHNQIAEAVKNIGTVDTMLKAERSMREEEMRTDGD